MTYKKISLVFFALAIVCLAGFLFYTKKNIGGNSTVRVIPTTGSGTESDTLLTVTNRGGVSTSTAIYFYGGATTSNLTATGTTSLQEVSFTSGTGTSLQVTSGTIATLGFGNATGTDLFSTQIRASGAKFASTTSTRFFVVNPSSAVGGLQFSSNDTDRVTQIGVMSTRSWDINEKDVVGFVLSNSGSTNTIYFGGGSNNYNSATKMQFRIGSTTTTLAGSNMMYIDSNGVGINWGSSVATPTSTLTVNGSFRAVNATTTNSEILNSLLVGGQSVCLANGTNCPTALTGITNISFTTGDFTINGGRASSTLEIMGGSLWTLANYSSAQTNVPTSTPYYLSSYGTMIPGMLFDATNTQYGFTDQIHLGDSCATTSMPITFYWTSATGTGDVVWGIRAKAVAEGEYADSAWSSWVYATGTFTNSYYRMSTSTLTNLTPASWDSCRDTLYFQVVRSQESGDTFGGGALLEKVVLEYGKKSLTD